MYLECIYAKNIGRELNKKKEKAKTVIDPIIKAAIAGGDKVANIRHSNRRENYNRIKR